MLDLSSIYDWVQRKGAAPPSPPDDATAPSPAPDPQPAAPSPMDAYMASMRDYVSKYANPDALAQAQAQDRRTLEAQRFAQNMGNATGLMINNPGAVKFEAPNAQAVQQYLQRQGLAQGNLGLQSQMMMLPFQMRKTVAETAKAEAEPGKITAETQATLAGIPKTQAEARKATAEAQGSEIENGPAAPAMLAMGAKLGVKLPPETTNKQAREILDAEAKRQGLSVDWAKVDLERFAKQVELARYASEHPNEPTPGYHYVGPGGAPARDSEPVKGLQEGITEASTAKDLLKQMRDIYDRNGPLGRIAGPDAQALDSLHERLLGSLGRQAAGGRLAAYDVTLAKQQLPRPSSIAGGFRPGKIHAALDTVEKAIDSGLDEYAKARNFQRAGAAPAATPTGPAVTRTVNGETRTWNGSAWVK